MKHNRNPLAKAVSYALGAGMVASLAMTAAPVAAQEDEEAADLERFQVTGSRISRTDIEGPAPVTVISREDLDMSGRTNLADYLRELNFNSFGSFNERSGTTAQGLATLSLRGLGAGRTLVLVNGRRRPPTPVAFGAEAADLNQLPMEAIERVEILSDSASAVYGSDAVGGVVNVILRDDFTGGQVSLEAAQPTRSGGGDEERAAFTMGGNYDGGSFLVSAEMFRREGILDRDRHWSAPFDPGTGALGDTRGISPWGNSIIPLEPWPDTGTFESRAAPNCPTDVYAGVFTTPITGNPGDEVCGFAYAEQSIMTADLDRQTLFLTADYELDRDHRLYFDTDVSRVKTFGRYAPAVGLFTLPGAIETNPFGIDVQIGHRFVDAGPRDSTQTSYRIGTTLGLEGRFGDVDYDFALRHHRQHTSDFGENLILIPNLLDEIAQGRFDVVNPTNPEDPAAHAAAVANMTATESRDLRSRFWDAQLILSGDAGSLRSGPIQWAAGAEYRQESFQDKFDAQAEAGNILGSAGGSGGGSRYGYSVFTEWLFPLHDTLELTAAARFDDYEFGGDEFSPQLALRYTPMDNLLLRASWSEGFRVPNLDNLFQAPSQSFEFAQDFSLCEAQGIPIEECPTLQFETFFLNNPDLAPETSESINIGVVFEPMENLALTADVYEIEIEDVIQNVGTQRLLELEWQGIPLPEGARIERTAAGAIDFLETGPLNIARREVRGYDLSADYQLSTDFGMFGANVRFSRIWRWFAEQDPLDPGTNFIGRSTAPGNRGNWQFSWAQGDYRVAYTGHWIDSTFASGTDGKVPSFVQHDVNASWFAPWDAEIRVGVRNIADRDPSLSSLTGDLSRAAQSLYPVQGRVFFGNYTQRF